MTDSMVERVARTLREDKVQENPAFAKVRNAWEEMSDENREFWRAKARAAIEAMREPTDAMVAEMEASAELWDRRHMSPAIAAKYIWVEGIDAALAEPVPK